MGIAINKAPDFTGKDLDAEVLDEYILDNYFSDIENLEDLGMLYGHSDIKIYSTVDSSKINNLDGDTIKSIKWFSRYDVAKHVAHRNATKCIVEMVINTEGMLDLLNPQGIIYINKYYEWLKESNAMSNKKLGLEDILTQIWIYICLMYIW